MVYPADNPVTIITWFYPADNPVAIITRLLQIVLVTI